jgi:hypothetical protein
MDCEHSGTCSQQPTAWCSFGCVPHDDATPICRDRCAATLDRCKAFSPAGDGCAEHSPPRRPELWPVFSQPGWWCWKIHKAYDFGGCAKAEQVCNWQFENLLDRELTRDRVIAEKRGHACERPTTPVYCFSWYDGDHLGFTCGPTEETCRDDRDRLVGMQGAGIAPVKVTDLGTCEVWPYD